MNLTMTMNIEEFREAFNRAPEIVTTKLQSWVVKSSFRAEREAKLQLKRMGSSNMSGRTSSSIRATIGILEGKTEPHTQYDRFTILGRKPGRMPPFAPDSDLAMWARRAGINPFLVARAIGRKGTKGVPYMDEAGKRIENEINNDANDTVDDIIRSLI